MGLYIRHFCRWYPVLVSSRCVQSHRGSAETRHSYGHDIYHCEFCCFDRSTARGSHHLEHGWEIRRRTDVFWVVFDPGYAIGMSCQRVEEAEAATEVRLQGLKKDTFNYQAHLGQRGKLLSHEVKFIAFASIHKHIFCSPCQSPVNRTLTVIVQRHHLEQSSQE